MVLGITPSTFCTKFPDKKAQCNADGLAATKSAITIGNVGTVVGAVGGAAVVFGVYLWLRSPSESSVTEHQVSLLPQVGPDGCGLVAAGRF